MIAAPARRSRPHAEIDDPEHLLRSGMFASFVIRVGDPVRSVAVPVNGVTREGDGTMTVWVVTVRARSDATVANDADSEPVIRCSL